MSCILSIFAEMDRDNPLESFMLFSRVWVDQRFMYSLIENAMRYQRCQGWLTQMRVIFSLAPPSNTKYREWEILKCGSLH